MMPRATGVLGKLLVVLVVIFMATEPADAQWLKPIEVYLGGGQSSPDDPDEFKQFFKSSYNFSFGVGMRTSSYMEIVGRYEYHRFDSDIDGYEGGLTTLKTIGADAKLNVAIKGIPLEPYFLLGMGMGWLRQDKWEPYAAELFLAGQTELFFAGGLGIQSRLDGPLGFFIQSKFISEQTSDTNKRFGNNLGFWALTVGVKLTESP
jgi:hypothetical protein